MSTNGKTLKFRAAKLKLLISSSSKAFLTKQSLYDRILQLHIMIHTNTPHSHGDAALCIINFNPC